MTQCSSKARLRTAIIVDASGLISIGHGRGKAPFLEGVEKDFFLVL
jgi:hypothetical protein